jgi:hypothetical protein
MDAGYFKQIFEDEVLSTILERERVEELEAELGEMKEFAKELLDAVKELCPEHELIDKQSEFAL